jgi:molybdopterin converting factor small subunit
MTEQRSKMKVSILGKGEETITVDKAETIGDLRNMLALDPDVQASTQEGEELSDDTNLSEVGDSLSFIPNVEGGWQ